MFTNKQNMLLIQLILSSTYPVSVQENLLVVRESLGQKMDCLCSDTSVALPEGDTTGSCNASHEIQLWRPINYKVDQRQGPLVTLSPACHLS